MKNALHKKTNLKSLTALFFASKSTRVLKVGMNKSRCGIGIDPGGALGSDPVLVKMFKEPSAPFFMPVKGSVMVEGMRLEVIM